MSKFLLFGFIGRACVFSVCVDLRRAPRDLADPHDRTAAMPDARSPQLQHHHEHHTYKQSLRTARGRLVQAPPLWVGRVLAEKRPVNLKVPLTLQDRC